MSEFSFIVILLIPGGGRNWSEQRLSISKEPPKDVPNSPREQIVAVEDSSLWKIRRRPLKCIFKGGFAWQMIKSAIFVICCAFFFIQSAEFYNHYYTYPTITNIAIVAPENVTLPAITYCDKNIVERTRFCDVYPDSFSDAR
ncbi:hypothetical protein CEXT_259441 [Caerostris extrusa]|uniref:Uncharacterized protein n=1 Tax=Caerostris extrusa TaxID=172846 RepID=A0AAV4TQ73_CAEEX|nr:hypothetical protein CEXT_259441 [Caerostris extrusa]